jgi:hypothetical protein
MMSSHRKLSVVLCPGKAAGISVVHRACTLVVLTLLLCSTAKATECITPESHARRYFDADLLVFGEVLTCTTTVVSEEDVSGDSGWMYHNTTRVTEIRVRIDSLLKGSVHDSIIIVQKKSTQTWNSRFLKTAETGDSLFLGEMSVLPGPGEASEVPSSGSWILFLTEKDGGFKFMWRADYNKCNLDLYKIFEEEGEEVFERYDLSAWSDTQKDSVWELRLIRKVPGDSTTGHTYPLR